MDLIYTIFDIALVVFGFTLIIAIHEAGHFLAAKRAGIECPVFSIGFPLPGFVTKMGVSERWRNIITIPWRGTNYRIGWIPFGGFVQMKGQSDNPTGPDDNAGTEDDFRNVSYGNKVLVICGGVLMNAITGILFFILAFMIFGVTFIEPVIGDVVHADQVSGKITKAWEEQLLQPGDRIVRVAGRTPNDFEDVVYAAFFHTGESIPMTVERGSGDNKQLVDLNVPTAKVHPKLDIDLPPVRSRIEMVITGEEVALSDGALERRDSLRGVVINGERKLFNGYMDFIQALERHQGGDSVTFVVMRDGELTEATYTPRAMPFKSSSYQFGIDFKAPVVIKGVQHNSPAHAAGMKAGDEVIALRRVDGQPIRSDLTGDWASVGSTTQLSTFIRELEGIHCQVRVNRANEGGEKSVVELSMTPRKNPNALFGAQIGVVFESFAGSADPDTPARTWPGYSPDRLVVNDVLPGSPAFEAGVRPGHEIVGFPGIDSSVASKKAPEQLAWLTASMARAAADGEAPESMAIQVADATGERSALTIKPTLTGHWSQPLVVISTRPARTQPQTFGFVESIQQGLHHSERKVVMILETLKGLFTGKVAITNLAGPVMIAKASYDLSQYGLGTLIFFMGFISINLAIVNILPLPVLDGGLLVIVTLEKLMGRPLNETMMGLVNMVAFVALIGFFAFILFNDIRNLVIFG